MRRPGRRIVLVGILAVLAVMIVGSALADSGSVLYTPNISLNPNEDASYPRVIRLAHSGSANGTLLATFSHSGDGSAASFPIYKSTDGGATWSSSPIGTQHSPAWDLDGPTLFEVPQTLGSLSAGTLLAAGTAWVRNNYTQQAIEVFKSTDGGVNWSYLSSCTSESGQANTQGHGIWEPNFTVDSAGELVCFFSDERPSSNNYPQVIAHVVSTNGGTSWGSEVYDVAVQDGVARPGMATVITLPNSTYLMSYEYCKAGYDPDTACSVYVKTSSNGSDWTPASNLGSLVQTPGGRHLLHTPQVAWSPAGGTNGTVIVSGQRVVTGADGSITNQPESGQVVMVNTNLGSGTWSELPTPFVVNPTGGYDSGETSCPGYSSPILPSTSGTSFLYLAGTHISNGKCEVRYGTASTGALPYSSSFASGSDAGWDTYGGSWSISNGVYSDSSSGPGDKSVAGSTGWTDYTLQGDVELNAAGEAGLAFRVTAPAVGADSFDGYYLGIYSNTGALTLGRETNAWTQLHSVTVSGGISTNTWYHLTVQAIGCTYTVSVQKVGSTSAPTAFTYTDTGCNLTYGNIGVRDQYTPASFRNITVSAGGTTSTSTAPYLAPFASGTATGWTTYGGTWSDSGSNETYSDSAAGAGDKSVAGSTSWGNYTAQGDVELTSLAQSNGNPGLLVRVTNPSLGADALNGYYAGLNGTTGQLVLGRETNGWTGLASTAMPGGVSLNTWYHITFEAVGCQLTVTAQAVTSPEQATISYTDTGCSLTTGEIGVRTFYAGAAWRFVTVTPR
jgi:hypothetical protein